MILPEDFCQFVRSHGISFFAGVPDSLLKNLCAYIDEHFDSRQHVITANEGNAIAMAMGHFLATGSPAVAYMQNSGLGNAINPLVSMTCEEVCGIPMLLIIGWRGEPGISDEPQHFKQGQITPEMLELLGIPYITLEAQSDVSAACSEIISTMLKDSKPVAILVRKNTFAATAKSPQPEGQMMSRETALNIINDHLTKDALVIATTGKTARELYEIQVKATGECSAFLTVGAMGHASSIAASAAIARPEKTVVCLDGDGAMIMHMGALPIIGSLRPNNLIHILLNNNAHESVGGQPTCAGSINIESLALANGYAQYISIESEAELVSCLKRWDFESGPCLMEIKIKIGARKDLGRPEPSPYENTRTFLKHAK
ncbi:phosphonopyruvate decarboxylase [Planctobacterium marinum]|uniref:Phosphonopyruvate decarboxylase n=1 Tax=Planctobacterium marinum TaxID=1631968 RepID=A0AA48HXN4_9ALTE|nr:phosphonopyruvate decarboxylase [Planctobacterium marinum]